MSDSILITNGTVITMNRDHSVFRGDVVIRGGRIAAFFKRAAGKPITIDATDCAVLPGFVQTHVHLCQTLFRGSADDLSLIDWLRKRIWPMEAAHTEASVRASARLGIAELLKGGTTCALTMETVNHTDEVFNVVEESGFRATVGKCMMDQGQDLPTELHEQTEESLRSSLDLLERWHLKDHGRIRYCFAPRFAISCSRQLLERVAQLARERQVMVHTHASESRVECELVQQDTGFRNISYLHSLGLTGAHVALAHCIHLNDQEIEILGRTGTNVVHCPSSNLKLGSGIAPVKILLEKGVSVSLGADGAACNNRLDMFTEMRTAALLQKALHGPEALGAEATLQMATIGGARAMGLADEIGSIELGKVADVIVVRLNALHSSPHAGDVVSTLVYSAQPGDVETVIIDGRILVQDGKLQRMDVPSITAEADREARLLLKRAGRA